MHQLALQHYLAVGAILFMRHVTPWVMIIGFAGVLYTFYAWWADVIKEANGHDHTAVVRISHRYGRSLALLLLLLSRQNEVCYCHPRKTKKM